MEKTFLYREIPLVTTFLPLPCNKLHNGERWNLRDREETLEDLFADAEYMLENKLEIWQDEEDPKSERATKKFDIYLKVKETETLYNKIKQELKMLLFNNRSLIIEN